MGMILTDEQQAILDGAKGETMAKVMKTLVMFGEAFHAEKMVPVTSRYNHLVTSFGLGVLQPVYDLMQQLIDAGAVSGQKFSADPRPLDPNVPANLLQQLVFKKFMYNKQDFYEGQLEKLGLLNKDAFTCTCYMSEVGNKPEQGEVLSWSESSAVVYANSVLGARCNRNSGIMDIMGSIVGYVPYFGLLTDEGRKVAEKRVAANDKTAESILDLTQEQLVRTFQTNIFSMFYLVKAALPHLPEGGAIVNTTSVTAYQGSPNLLDYSATKGAITAFTRSLSENEDLVSRRIRVNGVAPGPIWTPLNPASYGLDSDKVKHFGESTPMGRPGQPYELAPAYVFLASDDSSYVSGQVIHVNGGTVVNG